jgi:ABC-2 type transport system ATP-binding protein
MSEVAVSVQEVSKRYRLYQERNNSLKAAMMRGGRAKYDEFWALRDVSLEIPEGSTYGLIGHNGSGKSTLLKCMAKILRPDEGRIVVSGKVSALLELGAGFHPELSGRENVYLNGSILGLSKRQLEERFDEIVEFAGLEQFIDSPVKNYSSGMYVRLGFSVAINVDPDVLLIDEVLAVGDEGFQKKCNERFADLRKRGKTIVIVSHALGSLRNMCDTVAWIEHGRVREIGPPGVIVDDYVEDMHPERESVEDADDEVAHSRWGAGDVLIEKVEILGPDGQPTHDVKVGEDMTLRFHYRVRDRAHAPVFGFAIIRDDGLHLTSLNTRESGLTDGDLTGSGYLDYALGPCPFVPQKYHVTASVSDHADLEVWDMRPKAAWFDVYPGTPRQVMGAVAIAGRWAIGAE